MKCKRAWTAFLAIAVTSLGSPQRASAGAATYTYDALGRVASVAYSNGTTVTYAYDPAGNRSQVQVTSSTSVPNANAVSATVATNSSNNPISLNITGGTPTSVAVSTQALHGAATAGGTAITYTPATSYAGADTFQYTASNANGTSQPATVSVTVSAAAPIANAVSATVAYGSANNSIGLNITGGPATSVAVSSPPSHGAATASGTVISYTPAGGYSGADSFQYTASNGSGTSSPATASITVKIAPPNASAVTQTVQGNSTNNPISLSISGTYSSVAVSTQASNGTATASGTSITYTPNSSYYGPDIFGYTATNAGGTSSPASATLTVAVPAGTVLYASTTAGSWSYTVPAGVAFVNVEGWGGGGGGSDAVGGMHGWGGGGGAYFLSHIAVTANQVLSGTVGGGGAGGPVGGQHSGAPGNPTTVTLTGSPTAGGGQPGTGGGVGAGGTASGGQTNTSGSAGSSSNGGLAGNHTGTVGQGGNGCPTNTTGCPGSPGNAGEIKITAQSS